MNNVLTLSNRTLTVTKLGRGMIELRGPRGGEVAAIRNIRSGAWCLVEGGRSAKTTWLSREESTMLDTLAAA